MGVVWCGVVRCGVVQHGIAWYKEGQSRVFKEGVHTPGPFLRPAA